MTCFNNECKAAGRCVAAPNTGCRASMTAPSNELPDALIDAHLGLAYQSSGLNAMGGESWDRVVARRFFALGMATAAGLIEMPTRSVGEELELVGWLTQAGNIVTGLATYREADAKLYGWEPVYRRTSGVTVVCGSPAPKPPCAVCGTPYEKHGTAPTCASHDYTDGGHIVLLVPAGVAGTLKEKSE